MKALRLMIPLVAALAIVAPTASAADDPVPNISVLTSGPADGTTATTQDVTWSYEWNGQSVAVPDSHEYGTLLGFFCSIDLKPFGPCGSSYSAPGLADGHHQFAVYASYIGNVIFCEPIPIPGSPPCEENLLPVSTNTLYASIVVDTSPPSLAFTGGLAQGAFSGQTSQRFTFTASDAGSFSTTCSLDGATSTVCSSPADLTGLSEGRHEFTVVAADENGHSQTATRNFTIDASAPTVAFTRGPAAGSTITSNHPSFYFESSDLSSVTFSCIFDGAAAVPCSSPFRKSKLAVGAHFLVVTPIDVVGNTGSPIARMFTVKAIKRCVKRKLVRSKHGKHRRVCVRYRLAHT